MSVLESLKPPFALLLVMVSSVSKVWCSVWHCLLLLPPRFSFFGTQSNSSAVTPHQVDLGQDKMVSGVMIQGGKHRDRNVFMKKFKVGHSLDGDHWTFIKEENTTRAKVTCLNRKQNLFLAVE